MVLLMMSEFLHGSAGITNTGSPLKLTPYIRANRTRIARLLSWDASPGVFPSYVGNDHYSGYITVNETLGNHYFFWYFQSPTNSSAPLVVWLNGGPGHTSMQGLFWQNGPMKLTLNNTSSFTQRENTLVGPFSVLYIDNPVGVGYSFSDSGAAGLRGNVEEYGQDLAEFMEQFVKMFPQYQRDNDVYIGGQSYAGKYVPAVAFHIHRAKAQGNSHVNLKGIYLSGPLFEAETCFKYSNDYHYSLGIISKKQANDQKVSSQREFDKFKSGQLQNETSGHFFNSILPFEYSDNYLTREYHDVDAIIKFVNASNVRRALHVGNTPFKGWDGGIFSRMIPDIRRSVKSRLATLMDHYKVLVYGGDFDALISTNCVEGSLLTTPWAGLDDYKNAARTPWMHNGKVLGYYSRVRQFCRVVVKGAGHQVGIDQEESQFLLLKQFMNNGCVR